MFAGRNLCTKHQGVKAIFTSRSVKSQSEKGERLAIERGRLSELKDPMQRSKSYVRISDLLLDFIAGAANDRDVEAMSSLLDQYTSAIRSARDIVASSELGPTLKPAGYKDLELALRRQARRLRDIGATLGADERLPVDRALAAATSL